MSPLKQAAFFQTESLRVPSSTGAGVLGTPIIGTRSHLSMIDFPALIAVFEKSLDILFRSFLFAFAIGRGGSFSFSCGTNAPLLLQEIYLIEILP